MVEYFIKKNPKINTYYKQSAGGKSTRITQNEYNKRVSKGGGESFASSNELTDVEVRNFTVLPIDKNQYFELLDFDQKTNKIYEVFISNDRKRLNEKYSAFKDLIKNNTTNTEFNRIIKINRLTKTS